MFPCLVLIQVLRVKSSKLHLKASEEYADMDNYDISTLHLTGERSSLELHANFCSKWEIRTPAFSLTGKYATFTLHLLFCGNEWI